MYQHSFNCTVSLDYLIMIRVADRQWCKSSYIQYNSFLKSKTTEYWAPLVIKSRGFSTGFLPVFWRQKHSTFITIIWNSLGQKYYNKEEKSSWTFVVPLCPWWNHKTNCKPQINFKFFEESIWWLFQVFTKALDNSFNIKTFSETWMYNINKRNDLQIANLFFAVTSERWNAGIFCQSCQFCQFWST